MIDTDRISELEAEIGADDLTFIVALFLGEAEDAIAEIAGGLADDAHARATHFLRSGALNIGLTGFAEAADAAAAVAAPLRAATAGPLATALDETRAALGHPAIAA
ncbi:hypothetical protein ACK8OR_17585 [Jannaschia sp. KMU-145]|uniref:hypothetical protein n=1 Tax=Jannaschia halovivens TaxID=3388667 RepID=UPI00396B0398